MTQVQELLMQVNSAPSFSGMALLYSKEQRIPGSTQYQIKRYLAQEAWGAEDTACLSTTTMTKSPRKIT